MNLIPGINVGNAVKQVGSVVGLAPKGDYDILDSFTNSNRAGQTQVNWMPDPTSGPQVMGVQAPGPAPQGNGPETFAPTGETQQQAAVRQAAQAAAVAAQQKRDNTIRSLRTGASNAEAGGRQGITDVANSYDAKSMEFANKIQGGQDSINTALTNNGLNLRRSMSNIVNGVRTGLRSGGVTLAGYNASDSGAADAMARAYAKLGNNQMGDANNQALLVDNEQQGNQRILNRDKEQGEQQLESYKGTETGRVRGDVSSKLGTLLAQGQNEGVDGVIDMGVVDRIIGEGMQRLMAADQARQGRLAGVRGLTAEEINAEAARLDQLGAEGTSPFAYEAGGVMEQGTPGAPITQLPMFMRQRKLQA